MEFLELNTDRISTDISARTEVCGLNNSAVAFAVAQCFSQVKRDILVVCPSHDLARVLESDLRFFLSKLILAEEYTVQTFSAWELSPYSRLTPVASYRNLRLRTLQSLRDPHAPHRAIVTSIQALSQPTIRRAALEAESLTIRCSALYPLAGLAKTLTQLGFYQADLVQDRNSFAIRGGIVDLFPPNWDFPLRLDFFGDEVERIRKFDPSSQRSVPEEAGQKIERFTIGPTREIPCAASDLEGARHRIRAWCDQMNFPRSSRERINRLLKDQVVLPEFDFLHTFFDPEPDFLWNHLRDETSCIWVEDLLAQESMEKRGVALAQEYEQSCADEIVCCPPEELNLPYSKIRTALNVFSTIHFSKLQLKSQNLNDSIFYNCAPIALRPKSASGKKSSVDLDGVSKAIRNWQELSYSVFFVANSQAQLDRFSFLLAQREIVSTFDSPLIANVGAVSLLLGNISHGFVLEEKSVVFLSEDDVFGKKVHQKKVQQKSLMDNLSNASLDNLEIGEQIVHIEHGIGAYQGLIKITTDGIQADYVAIEYAKQDKLYLPIYRLELIQKYVGPGGKKPPLDKLGSGDFGKAKGKAKRVIKEIALKLLRIYAEREAAKGFAFPEPDSIFREFEASFPYDETPDQFRAIEETISDMCSDRPMDRLICGDVGYGKTEVAMRAAFLAVSGGKQVALLVPTTVLAEQHSQNFKDRFTPFGINVDSLSRFKTRKQQLEILAQIKSGSLDIIIGTHRLLSKDIEFKDLGLLIIDEEQRFGVEHKERMLKLRVSTDVLTLTATPIPRTLHMGMVGIRDISIIYTAPSDRLSIQTFLCSIDKYVIKEAITKELQRGGQVFFIHNRVQSIPTIFRMLSEIVPEAKIRVAHGQMPEKELESVMIGFYQRKFDVLLATAIIENGLDVPHANTILINRADTFGLSQLYQIRGRVGRSQTRAYAYLLLPEDVPITEDAKERLNVLQRHSELGSGFAIASHDLEIRGAGDIIGDAQSGHVTAIGYDLYMELLAEEVNLLKGEDSSKSVVEVEITSTFPTYIPEDYVPDVRSRLSLYKKLSSLNSEEEIEDGKQELLDRYGPIPLETDELLWLLRVKVLLKRYGFVELKVAKSQLLLTPGEQTEIDPKRLVDLIGKDPQSFGLSKNSRLIIRKPVTKMEEVFIAMRYFVEAVSSV